MKKDVLHFKKSDSLPLGKIRLAARLAALCVALCLAAQGTVAARAEGPICGQTEHTHSTDCYVAVLVCGHDGEEGHEHTAACYAQTLNCGLAEHIHTAACYPAPAVSEPEPTAVPEPTPSATETPAETSQPTESAATPVPDPTQEPAPLSVSVTASPEQVYVGEAVALGVMASGADSLTYTISGPDGGSQGSVSGSGFSYTPASAGAYSVKVVAARGQDVVSAQAAFQAVEAPQQTVPGAQSGEGGAESPEPKPELSVSVSPNVLSTFPGNTVVFSLQRNAAAEGAAAKIVVTQRGNKLYESDVFESSVSVQTKSLGQVTNVTLSVTLTAEDGRTASASASVPCAIHEVEIDELWEYTVSKYTRTGEWGADVLGIARTQLGYLPSENDFIIEADGSKHGWCRYGAYGKAPYDGYCGLFVSFCLHYARVPEWEFPQDGYPPRWVLQLESMQLYEEAAKADPQPGDLIFFDWESDGVVDHVGVYAGIIYVDGQALIQTVEGNRRPWVSCETYLVRDSRIVGYGLLSKAYEAWKERQEPEVEEQAESIAVVRPSAALWFSGEPRRMEELQ